jgi:methylated-DNA-[protein]-cysteine S-methyltransferase
VSGLVETFVASPVGELRLVASDDALLGVFFVDHTPAPTMVARRVDDHPLLRLAARELAEYFAETRQSFDVPLALDGTPHQCAVWRALATIPFGTTTSYGELARTLPHPSAARALGHANARNPLSIVLPCHRVVGASGALTGYAGGLARKSWLLEHEAKIVARDRVGNLRASLGH